ncbi:MAG TPA: acetyltransferase [Clostridiaceae bacterium]|nr:acetyltransferase [Clostridiaceae bacterium]
MKKILIIGAGGHGRVTADIAQSMKQWTEIAFLDDDESIKCTMGFDIIGRASEALSLLGDYEIFVAIGNNNVRARMYNQLKKAGAIIPILIHPSTTIGLQVTIKQGTVIMPGAVINCGSTIGEGCIINTAATIDHDCNVGDYVHISPGVHIAGTVNIGQKTWIGIGAIVSNNLCITDSSTIGAGSVVINDIKENGTCVGVPAKRIK